MVFLYITCILPPRLDAFHHNPKTALLRYFKDFILTGGQGAAGSSPVTPTKKQIAQPSWLERFVFFLKFVGIRGVCILPVYYIPSFRYILLIASCSLDTSVWV